MQAFDYDKEEKIYIKSPLVFSEALSNLNSDSKTNVYLKLDNLQPAGSFKTRGISELAIQVALY